MVISITSQKNITRNLFSRENIEYSLIFLLLSIIFFYYVDGPIVNSFSKTEIAKEISSPIIIPSNIGEFLYWLIFASTWIPFLVFVYKRKYGPFVLGFFIPSLIINIYTYCNTGNFFSLNPLYIEWLFLNLVPPFILIYLLRRSKTIKEDILSITFFVFLRGIFFRWSMMYYDGLELYIPTLIFFTFFAAAYLILLSFAIEKIAKVKIFRHAT